MEENKELKKLEDTQNIKDTHQLGNDDILLNKIEHEMFKVPLFERNIPHIFIQNALEENRFRFSTSYEKLNKEFGIKIEILRDNNFRKISNFYKLFEESKYNVNKYGKGNINFKQCFKAFENDFYYTKLNRNVIGDMHEIIIEKVRFKNTTIYNNTTIILVTKKLIHDKGIQEVSQGIFFASEKFNSLSNFLQTLG